MEITEFMEYCMSLPAAEQTMPFDDDVLVYKVGGKIFAYATISDFSWVGVKCDPERAVELRERHPDVGYASHMSKVHWVGLATAGDLTPAFINGMIRDSYDLIVKALPRAVREEVLAAAGDGER